MASRLRFASSVSLLSLRASNTGLFFTRKLAAAREAHVIFWIIAGAAMGVALGLALNVGRANPEWRRWLGMPGTLYLRALTLLVVPLVFFSIVIGIANLRDSKVSTRRVSRWTLFMYALTTLIAIGESLITTYALRPAWSVYVIADDARVSPSEARFDSRAMITLTSLRHTGFFNASTAATVRLVFPGGQPQDVSLLYFWYAQSVTFQLPPAFDAAGPWLGVPQLAVYSSSGELSFVINEEDGGKQPKFRVVGGAGRRGEYDTVDSSDVSSEFEEVLFEVSNRTSTRPAPPAPGPSHPLPRSRTDFCPSPLAPGSSQPVPPLRVY